MEKINYLIFFLLISYTLTAQDSYTEVPIHLKDNLIYIPIRINQSKTLNFLFDTGAEVTVLDKATADELGLKIDGTSRIGTAGNPVLSETSPDNTISIGEIKLDAQSIEIFSIGHLSEYLGLHLDGIIGYELLRKYIIRTDLDQMKFIITDSDNLIDQDTGLVIEKIDLENHHFGLPLTVQFSKKSEPVILSFKFDTAFPGDLVFYNTTVKKYQLMDAGRIHKNKGVGADTTVTHNLRSRVHRVELDDLDWKNVSATLQVDPVNIEATKKARAAGLVGNNILNRFNITYDYRGNKVYMEKRIKK
ncbi:MAG: retropepsin-like domain-containing protein [Saprospiraceae bacterium]|nr:retropepsin-like domain-containing protein [Saprospiraceae bacterium]